MKNLSLKNGSWYNDLLLASLYLLALYVFQFFIVKAGFESEVPNPETLLRFDAGVYQNIAGNGYSYPDAQCNNTGCYMLFPLVWRILHVGIISMTLVNILFFSAGFAIICSMYQASVTEKMLWLTTPSLYFIAAPYSEALFCLLTAVSLYGIRQNKRSIIWIGLFLLSLTRATAIFLIPALLLMELVANDRSDWFKAVQRYLVNYALPVIAGLAVFVSVQYYQTGIWFAYYKQQIKYLGHEWALPKLPFQNCYGGLRIMWLEGLAMVACLIALVLLLKYVYNWLAANKVAEDRVLILSLTYLPIVLFSIVFCNPTWGASGTTNIFGLHRYTLCTPFIFVFLHHATYTRSQYRIKDLLLVFLLCNIALLSLGSYLHILTLLYYNFITIVVLLYMLHNNKKYEWAPLVLIAINVYFQVQLYQQYLSNQFTD